MHNKGQLDVISEFRKLSQKDENRDFFLLKHVFEGALPSLDAPVPQVMDCVKHLTLEAGEGMTAQVLMKPFITFCENDQQRPSEVFSISTKEIDEEFDFVSSAIVSGSRLNINEYVKHAITLAKSENRIISLRAIFSLGRIDYKEHTELIQAALEIIISVATTNKKDLFLAESLKSLVSLFLQDKNCKSTVLDFIQNHQEGAKDQLIHAAAEILFFEREKIPNDIETSLLELACKVKPKNQGTINKLDYAFSHILKKGEFNKVIIFLEKLFEQCDYEISISTFDSLIRELFKNKDTYLSELITRWFLSRKVALGRCCLDLFDNSRDKGIAIKCDVSQLSGDYEDFHSFLARKACGWLFPRQIAAISFILSLIDSTPDDQLEEISEIVFNPLLISYSGSVKEYLEDLPNGASNKLKRFITLSLTKLHDYHDNLRQVSKINELKPSETQRYTYSRYHNKIMNEVHNEARQQSVFLSIVKESILLYGSSSIDYVHHDGGKTRQETQMQKVSTRFEFPSLQYIDPHGLNNLLQGFRLEGCIQ